MKTAVNLAIPCNANASQYNVNASAALLMHPPAMPMHPDTMLMPPPAMPMHPDTMLMRRPHC